MEQTVVGLKTEDAYEQLKAQLTKRGCKITMETPPVKLTAKQGSIWGTSPKTAQKVLSFELSPENEGTRITTASALSSGYVRFALVGSVVAVAVLFVCAWISVDLASVVSGQRASAWSWLVISGAYMNVEGASMLSGLTSYFVFFLVAVLALEAGTVWYVRHKINCFAKEVLGGLKQSPRNEDKAS